MRRDCYIWTDDPAWVVIHASPQTRPNYPEERWESVDRLYDWLTTSVACDVAIVLSNGDAASDAEMLYIVAEPCLDLVLALSTADGSVSIHADSAFWPEHAHGFETLIGRCKELLRDGHTLEAVRAAMEDLQRLLCCA